MSFLMGLIAMIGTFIAQTSCFGCFGIILDEPNIPDSLIK